MLSVAKSVGSMALPYIIQGAKDIAQAFIVKTFGTSQKGSTKKVLGDCAKRVVDTFGNRQNIVQTSDIKLIRRQKAAKKLLKQQQEPVVQQEQMQYVPVKQVVQQRAYEIDQQE